MFGITNNISVLVQVMQKVKPAGVFLPTLPVIGQFDSLGRRPYLQITNNNKEIKRTVALVVCVH